MKTVAYGGGTNSTAMLIGMYQRGERVDLILFADTGGEMPHTYEYIKLFSAWLVAHDMPPIITVRANRKDATLEEECLRKKTLPSIAFGFKTCSLGWKVQPQEVFLNNNEEAKAIWKSGGLITKCIGYDADESRRAKIASDGKYELRYPLIEWGWGREECVESIRSVGLPLPGKSACFFCPSSKKAEVRALATESPELLARAVAMERAAKKNLTTVKGLGRHWSWEEIMIVKADDTRLEMLMDAERDMPCGCYDGEVDACEVKEDAP